MTKKTGVENPELIDLVTLDEKNSTFCLVMIEERPWDGSNDRLLELQAKFSNYLTYGLDGQMKEEYPESAGKKLLIQLDCWEEPDPVTASFLDKVSQKLETEGIKFSINILPTD